MSYHIQILAPAKSMLFAPDGRVVCSGSYRDCAVLRELLDASAVGVNHANGINGGDPANAGESAVYAGLHIDADGQRSFPFAADTPHSLCLG